MRKRVVCGLFETMVTLVPARRFTRVDLPALGAPTMATRPQRRVSCAEPRQPGLGGGEFGGALAVPGTFRPHAPRHARAPTKKGACDGPADETRLYSGRPLAAAQRVFLQAVLGRDRGLRRGIQQGGPSAGAPRRAPPPARHRDRRRRAAPPPHRPSRSGARAARRVPRPAGCGWPRPGPWLRPRAPASRRRPGRTGGASRSPSRSEG